MAAVAALERVFEPLELDDVMTRVQPPSARRADELPALDDDEGEVVDPESQTRLASAPHATGPLPEGSWPDVPPARSAPELPEGSVRRSTTASFASTSMPEDPVPLAVPLEGRPWGPVVGATALVLVVAVTVAITLGSRGGPSTPASASRGPVIETVATPQATVLPPDAPPGPAVVEAMPVSVSATLPAPRAAQPAAKAPASAPAAPRLPPAAAPALSPASAPPPPPPAPPATPAPPGTPAPTRRGID